MGNRDQIRNAAAVFKLVTNCVTRRFWRDHDDVQITARSNLTVMDGKAVTKGKGSALFDVWLNVFAVDFGLQLVRGQNHDNICAFNGIGSRFGRQAVSDDFLIGRAFRAQADNDINAAVFQVQRMSAALGAIAQNGNFLAFDDRDIAIFIVINIE